MELLLKEFVQTLCISDFSAIELPSSRNYSIFCFNLLLIRLFSRGGYYTTLVRKGLRIISINMNYCNNMNWWLLINNTDPGGQLQWMIGVLEQAEKNNEKVCSFPLNLFSILASKSPLQLLLRLKYTIDFFTIHDHFFHKVQGAELPSLHRFP